MVKSLRYLKAQLTRAEAKANKAKTFNVYSLKHFSDELENDYKDLKSHFENRDLTEAEELELIESQEKYEYAQSTFKEMIDVKLNRDPNGSFEQPAPDTTLSNLLERQVSLCETINDLAKRLNIPQESRLPALKIPTFSGDYRNWSSFKNLFLSRVGKNERLSNCEKLSHLLTLLSGEAAGLVKHLQLEDKNYYPAWVALEEKYDKPYRIAMDIIGNFKQDMGSEIKSSNISSFSNTFTETFLALENMSDYSNDRDVWVIHDIVERFDRNLKEKWASFISGNFEPTLKEMKEFLIERSEIAIDRENRTPQRESENFKISKKETRFRGNAAFVGGCFVCHEDHRIFDCEQFKSMSVLDRDHLVKSEKRCFNCLGLSHSVKACKSSNRCMHCKKMHHSLLHVNRSGGGESGSADDQWGVHNFSEVTASNCSIRQGVTSALLPTAVVDLVLNSNMRVKCRLLLDSGAQASFVTQDLVRKCNLRVYKHRVPVQVMSSERPIYSRGWVQLVVSSRYESNKPYHIKAYVFDRLTGDLPGADLKLISGRSLHDKFRLADPEFEKSSGVDIIVGADHFFGIVGKEKFHRSVDNLYVIESGFGWVVSGGSQMSPSNLSSSHCSVPVESYDNLINRFWDVEDVSEHGSVSEENARCENVYKSTTVREKSGRYSVELPFKVPRPKLGESFHLAIRRFYNLERRFQRDPTLKAEYIKLMDLFVSLGYVESVPDDRLSLSIDERFYLPHYAVTSKGIESTMKVRIVFDASMKSENGISLNDILMTGPNLQLSLPNLILKFSLDRYVFSADITKMYRQIGINESCRDYQRFLWRNEIGCHVNHYRLKTVMDGMSCSPFLALRTLQKLIEDEGNNYPLAVEAMSGRYMDDFFVGDNDLNRIIEKKTQLIDILSCAGMCLSKWASNDKRLVEGMPTKTEVVISDPSMVKTLGVLWNTVKDCFKFNLPQYESPTFTKRRLLSESAKIFDPAGWLAPITVVLKQLFQETWVRKIEWDAPLPDDIKSSWVRFRSELSAINELEFPRWIGDGQVMFIHGFCDASQQAYGAVVYSKLISSDGAVSIRLLASKTKVAPLKPISIARLELCGAYLLAKLINSLMVELSKFKVTVCCWSDSTTVLAWLAARPGRWVSFVAHRCGAIHELLPNASWRYINTRRNPADVVSRGLYPLQFADHPNWWKGPPWLIEFDESGPNESGDLSTEEEQKSPVKANLAVVSSFVETFMNRFSSLNKLRRTFAYMRRAVTGVDSRNIGELTAEEINKAFTQLIRAWQNEIYGNDIKCLKSKDSLSKYSRIVKLSPFLDEDGILRVGGRLENSDLSYEQKHPIILNKGHLAKIIVEYLHVKYYHAGVKLIILFFRSRFFVSGLRSIVKQCIRNCHVCLKFDAKTYQPTMGQLPSFRFSTDKPFSNCGVDFAGPLNVRPYLGRGKITIKAYVSVFVCLYSKAVHLELVHGLDTRSLILALKRFVSRRGRCTNMYSDNGKNFVGCARYITELKKHVSSAIENSDMQQYLANNLMSWHFIPPQSPTFGGIWEASVKSIKYHLYRVLDGRLPTVEELATFLCDIEAILNSRPMFPMSNDPRDLEAVTPSHLLNGHSLVNVPLGGDLRTGFSGNGMLSRYDGFKKSLNSFWRTWRNEYYSQELKKSKWYLKGKEPSVGDFVLIRRKGDTPMRWARGRIVNLYDGVDRVSRVVDVITDRGISREMVRNLVPLVLRPDASTGGIC